MRSTELFKENIKILKPKIKKEIPANDPARVALHKSMSQLLEEILDEDSTISSAVRRSPYADQLIRQVHTELRIPNDINWEPVSKVTWSEIKKFSPNFVLISGSRGTAAIRWSGDRWQAMMSSDSGIDSASSGSINEVVNRIKETVGKITGYWTGHGAGEHQRYRGSATSQSGDVEIKRADRKAARHIERPNTLDPKADFNQNMQAVLVKLRPLYAKYIEQAMADVKGVIGMALKNDAYGKVKQKIEILDRLKAVQEQLIDDPNSIPDKLKEKLRPALYLTSSHYYPDETGNFNLGGGYRTRSPENPEGQRKVISDIAHGDQKKLTTLMNFLKQSLLHP